MKFRRPVNKARSAAKFRHRVGRTRAINIQPPQRGGYRL
uniref:Uncharacterized protein n=1 Tax=Gokushovirinae environmental samples TaxID=1478972 RepID=A0A2R3UA91_9VIRU|nr:hypothetical protein [Gokushovirinae environmental samples]